MHKLLSNIFFIVACLTAFKLIQVIKELPRQPTPFGYSWYSPIPQDQIGAILRISPKVFHIKSVPIPHPLLQQSSYIAMLTEDNKIMMITSAVIVDTEKKCLDSKRILKHDISQSYPVVSSNTKYFTIWENLAGVNVRVHCVKVKTGFSVGIDMKFMSHF